VGGFDRNQHLPAASAAPASSNAPQAVSPALLTNKQISAAAASAMHLSQCSRHASGVGSLPSMFGGQSIHEATIGTLAARSARHHE